MRLRGNASGSRVGDTLGELGELGIRLLFFFERFLQRTDGVLERQGLGEGYEGAVERNLVMFHHVAVRDQRRVSQ